MAIRATMGKGQFACYSATGLLQKMFVPNRGVLAVYRTESIPFEPDAVSTVVGKSETTHNEASLQLLHHARFLDAQDSHLLYDYTDQQNLARQSLMPLQ